MRNNRSERTKRNDRPTRKPRKPTRYNKNGIPIIGGDRPPRRFRSDKEE